MSGVQAGRPCGAGGCAVTEQLRLGSRRSPMAIAQSRQVAEHDHRADRPTGGDRRGDDARRRQPGAADPDRRHRRVRQRAARGAARRRGGPGRALAEGPADRGPAAGIVLAAVPPRDDPRDALVARDGAKLADLPGRGQDRHRLAAAGRAAARAPRRPALRPDPRQRRHQAGQGGATASSTGWCWPTPGWPGSAHGNAVTQVFEPDEMLPAPGQGALAVECRDGEPELAALLAAVTDPASHGRRRARERSLLAALEAGCSAPVGGVRRRRGGTSMAADAGRRA